MNLALNWEKCIISNRDIKVDRAKVETIERLPPPSSMKCVRSFLGHIGFYQWSIKDFLYGFYRRFIKDFS